MTFLKRLQNFQKILEEKSIDYFIIENPIDLLYFTGLKLSAGKLIIYERGGELFVDGRYFEVAKRQSLFPVEKVSSQNLVKFFSQKKQNAHLGFDSSTTTVQTMQKLEAFMESHHLSMELVAFENPIRNLRMIKDSQEISWMKKAAALNWRGFEFICSQLKPGVTERQLVLEYEMFCKRNGAEKLSFDPIIAFGENTACPHHQSGSTSLEENQPVLIDIGVTVDHYCSDMTRVIFFGKPDEEIEKLYSIVRRAQNSALSLCKPGVKFKDLDSAAKNVFREEKVEDLFLHSLGHSLGLEIHEYPVIRKDIPDELVLKPGMVFTIEPGLYIEGIGGVRYEDTVAITPDGYENFYAAK